MRLVLFDVDGTILSARGAGRRAFAAALMEVYGTAGDIERYDLRGATDQRIVFELMEGAGLSRDGVRGRLDDCFDSTILDCLLGKLAVDLHATLF